MDRGAWWATVNGITKELDTIQQLNNNNNNSVYGGVWSRAIGLQTSVC